MSKKGHLYVFYKVNGIIVVVKSRKRKSSEQNIVHGFAKSFPFQRFNFEKMLTFTICGKIDKSGNILTCNVLRRKQGEYDSDQRLSGGQKCKI